jgi:hypothetical protein
MLHERELPASLVAELAGFVCAGESNSIGALHA